MRKYAVLAIFVFILLTFSAITLTNTMFVMQRVARVADAAGDVQVKKRSEADWRPLGDLRQVKSGDAVRTGADASLELRWVDGTRMKLDENTELVVKKCTFNTSKKTGRSLFRLNLGQVWVRVIESLKAGSKFEIATPTATAGVRGTVFSVAVDLNGGTTVSVLEGEVSVGVGGDALAVSAGHQLSCDGSRQSAVRPLSDDERAAWDDLDIDGPQLEVAFEPAAGEATSPELSIESELGASITVNGEPVELDRRARFAGPVTVDPDDGEIRVVARDARGRETVHIVELPGSTSEPAH